MCSLRGLTSMAKEQLTCEAMPTTPTKMRRSILSVELLVSCKGSRLRLAEVGVLPQLEVAVALPTLVRPPMRVGKKAGGKNEVGGNMRWDK